MQPNSHVLAVNDSDFFVGTGSHGRAAMGGQPDDG